MPGFTEQVLPFPFLCGGGCTLLYATARHSLAESGVRVWLPDLPPPQPQSLYLFFTSELFVNCLLRGTDPTTVLRSTYSECSVRSD